MNPDFEFEQLEQIRQDTEETNAIAEAQFEYDTETKEDNQ